MDHRAGPYCRRWNINPKNLNMFGLFKKKSEVEKLSDTYGKLMNEARAMSTSNRKASDELYAKAEEINQKIIELQKG